jgi:two-component system cell cycle response regulator DivK
MANVVLIVDDDPRSMKLSYDLLKVCGYTTLTATDGQQAVEMAKLHKPDLILMDIQLPVMDGLAATHLIKADVNTKDIPIIAATAYAMKDDEKKVFDSGCNGYITKPIDIQVLLATVEKHLSCKLANQTV